MLLDSNSLQIHALDNRERNATQRQTSRSLNEVASTVWSATASERAVLREAKLKAIKGLEKQRISRMSAILVIWYVLAKTKYCVRHWWPCPARTGQFFKKKYTRKQRDEIPSDRTRDEVIGNAYVFFVFLAIKNLSQFPQLNFTSADADTTPLGLSELGVV